MIYADHHDVVERKAMTECLRRRTFNAVDLLRTALIFVYWSFRGSFVSNSRTVYAGPKATVNTIDALDTVCRPNYLLSRAFAAFAYSN